MLINEHTAISTSKVLLVPYSKWHVPRYHEWMKNEEIQQATASERLTLPEEYAMQRSWRRDADKLTFIVCLPSLRILNGGKNEDDVTTTVNGNDDSADRMLGDINLFLRIEDAEETDEKAENIIATPSSSSSSLLSPSPSSPSPKIAGEVELMIAEKRNHKKGFGKATLVSFLKYITDHETEILSEFVKGSGGDLGPFAGGAMFSPAASSDSESESATSPQRRLKFSALSAKIGHRNCGSLALFDSVCFKKVSDKPDFFGEFELRRVGLDPEVAERQLKEAEVEGYSEVSYRRRS